MIFKEPIAIVGTGCLLPGAPNVPGFWNLLLSGKSQFRSLSENRFHQSVYLSSEFQSPDTSYTDVAAFIDDSLFFSNKIKLPRGHQMLLKALDEAIAPLPQGFFNKKEISVILGCMNPEDLSAESLVLAEKEFLKKALLKNQGISEKTISAWDSEFDRLFGSATQDPRIHYPSSLGQLVHQQLKTRGPAFCADSACASSLTAIELAALSLDGGEADIVVSGGIESNLGIETYVPFSHLGVLSKNQCLPFDSRTDGIVQGEGAVIFILKRLSDALRDNLPIWGLIEGTVSSSNGAKASLFSPSFESQKRIFQELNQQLNLPEVHYIEGHGTGTPVGDLAELTALRDAFSSSSLPIYLGSVKSIIGHTKGAAGAAGLLKCILALKHRTIPPSSYFQQSPLGNSLNPLVINSAPVFLKDPINPIKMRICSAGFGGANYHLAISEFIPKNPFFPSSLKSEQKDQDVCLVGFSEIPFEVNSEILKGQSWKIPPNVLDKLDISQISALLSLEKALEQSLIQIENFDKKEICIISASHTRTQKIEALTRNLQLKKLETNLLSKYPHIAPLVSNYRDQLIVLDETSCQSLNSMTSGRVANEFDFQGCNFHLDADFSSLPYALKVSLLMLKAEKCQLVIIFHVGESIGNNPILISRETMSCWILSTQDFANMHSLPQLGQIGEISFS